MDELQCVAAARRGRCALSVGATCPCHKAQFIAALAEQSDPGNLTKIIAFLLCIKHLD